MENNRREEENEEGSSSGLFKAIGAMAGLAMGAWGVYNLVSSSGTKKEEVVLKSASSGWEEEEKEDHHIGFSQGMLVDKKKKNITTTPPPENISWSPPHKGCFKLNTDASVKQNPTSVGIGGLLRDYKGEWIWVFTGKLDMASSDITEAELRAMKEGLDIAWKMNLSQIVVETDSQAAIDLIQKADARKHPQHLSPLIQDCQKLLAKPGRACRLQHTPSQGNRSADFLANRGHKEVSSPIFLHEPLPDRLTKILEEDKNATDHVLSGQCRHFTQLWA